MDIEENKLDGSHLDGSINDNNSTSAPSVSNKGNVQEPTQLGEKVRKKRKTRRFRKRAKALAKPYSRPDNITSNSGTSTNNVDTTVDNNNANSSTSTGGTAERKKRRRHKSKKMRLVYRHPEAPLNTNEFLIQDHKEFNGSPDIVESDENYDMTWEEKDEELFEQNYIMFSEVTALNQLSQRQLVDKILFLNNKLSDCQNELKKRTEANACCKNNVQLLENISRLKDENQRLKDENGDLRRRIDNETTTTSSSSPMESELDTKERSSDSLLEPA